MQQALSVPLRAQVSGVEVRLVYANPCCVHSSLPGRPCSKLCSHAVDVVFCEVVHNMPGHIATLWCTLALRVLGL